jgi:site-specific recombinase XerD
MQAVSPILAGLLGSFRTLGVLRDYWRQHRPRGQQLFAGQDGHKPITREAVHLALKKAAGRAQLTKRVYPHLLRHAFAAHLLNSCAVSKARPPQNLLLM